MKKLLAFIIASLIVGAIMLAVGYVSVTAAATPSLGQYQLEESYPESSKALSEEGGASQQISGSAGCGSIITLNLSGSTTYGEQTSDPVGNCTDISNAIKTGTGTGNAYVYFYEITAEEVQIFKAFREVPPETCCEGVNFWVNTNSRVHVEAFKAGTLMFATVETEARD